LHYCLSRYAIVPQSLQPIAVSLRHSPCGLVDQRHSSQRGSARIVAEHLDSSHWLSPAPCVFLRLQTQNRQKQKTFLSRVTVISRCAAQRSNTASAVAATNRRWRSSFGQRLHSPLARARVAGHCGFDAVEPTRPKRDQRCAMEAFYRDAR
jgi:hypothetical protein